MKADAADDHTTTTPAWNTLAVVVGAADSPYLPTTLAALAAQRTQPDHILIAALGSRAAADSTAMRDAASEAGLAPEGFTIVPTAGARTFGAAVRRALAEGGLGPAEGDPTVAAARARRWLWLLHDDSAPEPGALAELLGAVEGSRAIAIAGAKQVDWDEPDRLISVGVSATFDGQRFTGIEDGEVDQGQHDGREDIYAVGTAGMLIDAAVWRQLRGPDPALGPFLDGRDLSRRARLAGHRVVVVPGAVVRHARSGYFGLREADGSRTLEPRAPEPRHSYRARRQAILHVRLTQVPVVLAPLVALAAIVAAPVRALWRVATKELELAGEEFLAPLGVLAHPRAISAARRRGSATRKLPYRRLRPLQASWWDVVRLRWDRRLQAATERRASRAPSELEMAERAAVALRRRLTLGVVLLLVTALSLLTMAPVAFSGALLGGALAPVDGTFAQIWDAALAPWIGTGDGHAGPPDPFLGILGVLSLLTGGPLGTPMRISIAVLLVAAMPLAALGGWFAAGVATRAVLLRAWAALAWALGPPLLLGLGEGRLGAVIAHLALPFVALGVMRALGLDRRDVIVSGMVGAQRVSPRSSARDGVMSGEAKRARLAALADPEAADPAEVSAEEPTELSDAGGDGSEDPTSEESTAAVRRPVPARAHLGAWDSDEPPVIASNTADGYLAEDEPEAATVVTRTSNIGSLGAAAAAGLAFTIACAGAPALLPAGVLALIVLALALGRRRNLAVGRKRLVLVALPALVVFGPLLSHALATADDGGWRLIFADPGVPFGSDPGPGWLALLGWPAAPTAVQFLGGTAATVVPLIASGTVLAAAVLALFRGAGRARAIRIAWLLVAVGVLTAAVAVRVPVGIGQGAGTDGDVVVHGWAGPGTSLVLLGLLAATLGAVDGLKGSLRQVSFGWRQPAAVVATIVVVVGLVCSATLWTSRVLAERNGTEPAALIRITARTAEPVPALGIEVQQPPQGARVLALTPTADGLDTQLWRGDGPQLTETASAVALAGLVRVESATDPADPEVLDAADADLAELVAALASGSATDAAAALATHAVAVVVVPSAEANASGVLADPTERGRLVALLDSVLGLDRVTENDSGVIWRVNLGEGSTDTSVGRAQVVDDAGTAPVTVPSSGVTAEGRIPVTGTGRTLILAERADPAWRAWIGGQPLRSVEVDWRQAFSIPDGAVGTIEARYEPALHAPWRVVTIVILTLTVLLALPTRRRRLEDT
ncbi:glycosyltransferase family 2 protein [Occultella glacieicola]|uniref:Glycosyltransferase family 2 protein n=1 Tax=Occultella glacieicola TaxID=2518684 RepID=A0ABY2E6B1_9MICO|nr:glycosyltransferase [Occultella glacieicola]TDE96126.1 glycosyltransferase family 2 protein [Occultella glacieicola]